jgi:hypothetical protein
MDRTTLKRAQDNGIGKKEKTMNHSRDTARSTAVRDMETTVKTLAAYSAVSAERALNAAIVDADITRSWEEYLTLVDQYYAEDVEVSTDVSLDPLVGRHRLKSLLLGFLAPLHMMAEIGGLWVSIHEASIPGDSLDEQHSEWSLELIGVTGRRVTQTWCVRRRWKQSRVVSEYHYAHRQDGEALSLDDFRIAAPRDPDTVKPS